MSTGSSFYKQATTTTTTAITTKGGGGDVCRINIDRRTIRSLQTKTFAHVLLYQAISRVRFGFPLTSVLPNWTVAVYLSLV